MLCLEVKIVTILMQTPRRVGQGENLIHTSVEPETDGIS